MAAALCQGRRAERTAVAIASADVATTEVDPAPPIADWGVATRVAWQVASGLTAGQARTDALRVQVLRGDVARITTIADPVARRVTGLGAHLGAAEVRVVGRREWIRANIESIAHLTAPLASRLAERRSPGAVSRGAVGAQLGVVFGYLSTKVLGQYEVFLPGRSTGRLTLIGPNLLHVEDTMLEGSGVDRDQLLFGIVVHELAHRLQFEAVDWVRPHLDGLVEAYLSDARVDRDRLGEALTTLVDLIRERRTDPEALLEAVLTPSQAATIHRAQSLMTLLEGHGNAVMDWASEHAEAGHDPGAVRTLLQHRRGRALDRTMRTALGLTAKARQYAVGERFVLDVADRHGRDLFGRVWEDVANVPTADELEDPDAWARRIDGTPSR